MRTNRAGDCYARSTISSTDAPGRLDGSPPLGRLVLGMPRRHGREGRGGGRVTNEELTALRITAHFLDVIKRRSTDAAEVVEALRNPAVVEPHQGCRRFVGRNRS
ncbi:hypothetical protein ACWDDN_41420 [Streptomyces griseoruber]